MTIPVPKPPLTGYLTPPKLGLMKISSAYVKNCPLFGFIASKIGFNEDFRRLRQNVFDFTQHMVMPLPENLRHLQSGDGGNREGPAKKAPCGWLGHTHRAENEAEGMEAGRKRLRGSQSSMAAGWAAQRQGVHDMESLVQHVRPAEEQVRQW